MTLFSWFIGTNKTNDVNQKNANIEQKVTSFNANTMWPIATVRRNTIVKQQEFTNSIHEKEDKIKPKPIKNREGKI